MIKHDPKAACSKEYSQRPGHRVSAPHRDRVRGEDTTTIDHRKAIFISHANPEDNAFTLWLAAKLSSLGYEVWADVMRLRGGDDWQRKLEKALRDLSLKILFVGTPAGAQKQGVRNEIQIAHDVGKEIGDMEFIIPLRLRDFRAPFLIVHAQYIDFEPGWALGLSDLTKTLESYGVPRAAEDSGAIWRSIQLANAKSVVGRPERLASNWLEISRMPPEIHLFRLHGVGSPRSLSSTREGPWPAVPHRDGFLSFADPDAVRTHFGETLRGESITRRRVDQFFDDGWPSEGIERRDAENAFADLARQGIERFCISRGLSAYALSAGRNAWWANLDVAPTSKIVFRWQGAAGKRLMQGKSKKRGFHWHIGASFIRSSRPFRHVKLIERLIFTEDGKTPFADPRRMQRLRKNPLRKHGAIHVGVT